MLSVASPLKVRWESMKALCLVSEIYLLYFVLLPFHCHNEKVIPDMRYNLPLSTRLCRGCCD